MSMKRILITAPLRQSTGIFREYQKSLDGLIVPEGFSADRFFVVNDRDEIIPEIRGRYEVMDTGDLYEKTHNDHIWTGENFAKMAGLRNATIKAALEGGYDYWLSADTDLILQPETLQALIEADKDIVSEIFWTESKYGLWCNSWMYDQYDPAGLFPLWKKPGLYRVGMTGALMLVKTDVFRKGVDYTPIPNIKNALVGEDRSFCIRAACAGVEMYMDTHYPAEHLYTDELYRKYKRRLENEKNL